ncbi:MAG TPA: matrixin family metalloprotease [Tepidiformaceae bacterium]|nr:matrixin family metalloprotease [Tepidiformaceae bacterium]
MNRRYLLALIAIIACVAFSTGALADSITPVGAPTGTSNGSIVDVTRYSLQGSNVVRRDIMVDTRIAADPQAAADQVAGTANDTPTCVATADQGQAVAQYCLNSWTWPAGAMPVRVKYNPVDPGGVDVPSALGPIQNAIQQWSSVTPNFTYLYDGTTTARPTACDSQSDADGINTIAWVDGINGVKGILAQTCTVRDTSGALVEFDMQINSNIPWSIADPTPIHSYDLYSNILHEMGHGAGLAHSQYANAVMYASLNSATEKRTLTADDTAALLAKYGGAQAGAYRAVAPDIGRD